ncbi:hypothetical protein [Halorussus lipolyticus]|uniref:hypothetical protein n=1 Tax=Halorussus lipolyticus TaxID=3034024 RepID=UPI0023E80B91|nr:hypothetical protein [Halorussus sp. DT80]
MKSLGVASAISLSGTSAVTATERNSDEVYRFDVSELPESIMYLSDPRSRQRVAWELAQLLYNLERDTTDELGKYSSDDIAAAISGLSDARNDLRSFSRLVEVLHENNLAGIIDESLLNSVGKRADLVVHYAPLLGSVNNVLDKAKAYATDRENKSKYIEFVLSIACLCLEFGLMWVGVPYKLAWKGTNRIFFARSGTLFRLGRYGGNRFVAFFMSEVHWELREALFEDVVSTEKAKWVVEHVNKYRKKPQLSSVHSDVKSFVQNPPKVSVDDFQSYEFTEESAEDIVDISSDVFSEVVESAPEDKDPDSKTVSEPLVLKSSTDWDKKANSENDDSLF